MRPAVTRALAHPSRVASAALAVALAACSGSERPHVVLVTIDTLRADHVGAYGYEHDTTPHLDALGEESVLFERAYSHAPFTAPSHASLLTSLHPQSHGVLFWGQLLSPHAPTFQELLGARGYDTGAFHNHPGLVPSEITRGFDEVHVRYWEPWQPTIESFFAWADGAAKDGGPIAAWIHLWDAHRPYGFRDWREDWVRPHVDRGPGQLTMAYAERGFAEPRDPRIGRHEGYYNVRPDQRAAPIDIGGESRVLEAADWAYVADRYDAAIRYADQGIGALVAGLAQRGWLDDTVLVVTSDHGESLTEREPVWFTHDPFLYEENLRVPLVVRLPGGAHAGTRVAALARGIDVLPTILELADVPPPIAVPLQGLSLVPLIEGRPGAARYLFAGTQTLSAKESNRKLEPKDGAWLEHREVLSDGRLKVIHDRERDAWAAYDLAIDPGERVNLLAPGAAPRADVQALVARLSAERDALPAADRLDVSMTDEQKDALRALGYLGGEEALPPPPPPPPPPLETGADTKAPDERP